ncbi:hypothetical protein SEA_KARDASHIAN_61 [Streptomyces phage Kardashian]|nr:hypothetical protein SEA_KARDASHIAN_61 [Streptomyces phage Kardashian]
MPRNVFESNELGDEADDKILGDDPHILLPPLAEGHEYEITQLPSGRSAVRIKSEDLSEEPVSVSCGCGPYQGCSRCGKYQGDGLNRPDSRTLRHQDWPPQN